MPAALLNTHGKSPNCGSELAHEEASMNYTIAPGFADAFVSKLTPAKNSIKQLVN